MIISYKKCGLELKDISSNTGEVAFYFASFGNVDDNNDIIMKGAYSKTIRENKARIKHLRNHYEAVGTIKEIGEDMTGAYCVSDLAIKTNDGKDCYEQYIAKIITEHSQGFQTIKSSTDETTGIRTISEVKLWEVSSLTKWASNPNTPTLSVKSMGDGDVYEYLRTINLTLKKSNVSAEKAVEIQKEIDSIQLYLKSLTAEKITVQPINGGFDWNKLTEKLTN